MNILPWTLDQDAMLTWFLAVGMILGPVLSFVPQFLELQASQSVEGFSPYVCLILLLSNILRVFFWLQRRFQTTLLVQSLVMIVGQLLLLDLIVRIKLGQGNHIGAAADPSWQANYKLHRGFSTDRRRFWKWTYFGEYVAFLGCVVGAVGLVTALNLVLLHSSVVTELMGTVALATEATLAMPQLYQNFKQKSVTGLRMDMILLWLVGDILKTLYFIKASAPLQFLACGFVQLTVDSLILLQFWWYPWHRPLGPVRVKPFDLTPPSTTSSPKIIVHSMA